MKKNKDVKTVPDQQQKKREWVKPLYIVKDEDNNSPTRHSRVKPFTDKNIEHKW